MAWGILEDHQTPRPPGTVLLDDVKQAMMIDTTGSEFAHLKKDNHIVLQPQPSDSVNDPLNWPMKRKLSIIFTLICTGVAVGGMMSMLGTAGRKLAEQFGVTYPVLIQTLSPPGIMSNAIALFFASAIAAVWGKRVGIVVGAFVMWINMFSGYFANSLMYYRNLGIVSGVFAAPGELLLGPIITDLIFVHQRGKLMAMIAFIGVIGIDASHVIAGNIIAKLGVKYLYMISFGVMTPFLFAIFFLVWETTYERPPPPMAALGLRDPVEPPSPSSASTSNEMDPDVKKSTITQIETVRTQENFEIPDPKPYQPPTEGTPDDPKHTLRQNVRIYRGRVTDRNFFFALWQPFPFMVFPSVLFSTVINGAFITWGMVAGIISHQVLLYPPYNLQPDVLAYLGLPGSFVGLVSSVIAGISSDKLITYMAHRNNGMYEPEYRLILMIPAVIFSTLGFLILGPLYQNHAAIWKLVMTGLVFHISGPFATSSCVTYIFDTMQSQSTEAFVATSLFKHIFVFLATTYVPSWFAKVGAAYAFRTLAILNLSFALLGIPMYIFGKRLRGAVHRNKFLQRAARVANAKK